MYTSRGIHKIFIIYIVIIASIYADPSCKTFGDRQQNVVCTAGNEDYILKRGLVSDNNNTVSVTLRGCRISDVELESFQNNFYLKDIDLSVNKIEKLELGVLDESRQVTYLNMSYNMLTTFPLGLFDQKTNLEVLDLKGNRLNYLELGIFDPLKKLRHLDLSSNAIRGQDLSPYLFDQSKRIQFMDFSRNDMSESPDLLLHSFEALDFLNLDRCSLKKVPKFATAANLKTMKHLMLSTNQITTIDDPKTFAELDNLEKLNFVANMIESVSENVFKPLRNLKLVLLSYNKLKEIPENLFNNLRNLITIDLSHNFIEYVPVNAFRGTALKNLNLASNKFTYLTDNFILELRNSGARLTKFYFNQNPWQCACMLQILNEAKLYEIVYNKVKYNGKEPVCVTKNEFSCHRHREFNAIYVEMFYKSVKK